MQITHVEIPSSARDGEKWRRVRWGGLFDPGDTFTPAPIGKTPATVMLHVAETPEDAKVRFQHSPDGKRGWRDLEAGEVAYFKVRPGDLREWHLRGGYLRPVVDSEKFGRIAINVTVIPQAKTRMTGEAVA